MAEYINPQWQLPNNIGGVKDNNFSLDFTWPGSIDSGYAIGSQKEYSFSIWFRWTKDGDPTANYSYIFGSASSGNAEDYRASLGLQLVPPYPGPSQVRFHITMGNGTGSGGYYWNSSQTVPANLLNGEWHHFVLNVNETGQDLYIDNSLFYQYLYSVPGTGGASVGNPTTGAPGTSNYFIGNNGTAVPARNNLIAHAEMSNFAIFDYELNTGQIASLYGSAANGSGNPMGLASPPIAYYPLGNAAWPNGMLLVPNAALQDYVFDFNGAEYVSITDGVLLNSSGYTVSMWFNANSFSSVQVLVFDTSSQLKFISIDSATSIRVRDGSSNGKIFTVPSMSVDNWYNIIVSVNNGSCKVYLNSTESTTSAQTVDQNWTINGINGYSNTHGGSFNFNGEMSNAQIFNTALSGPEITTLYNYGSPIQTLASIPQSSNLKLWYKLDASEIYNSTTTEWSIDNNQNPSAYSSSLNFDGTDDYINIPSFMSDLPSNDIYTISTWIKTTSDSDAAWGSSNNGSDLLYAYVTNGTKLGIARGSVTRVDISNLLTVGEWANVVAVFDTSTNLKIYINGVFIQNVTVGSLGAVTDDFKIGGALSAYPLACSQSNVSVWDTALTSPQVTELYNNGTPSNLSSYSAASNLVSWWKLNNTTTGIEDSKGSNNGTNNGATEYPGFVNVLAGDSSGMNQASLIQSDLLTTTSYSPYALQFDGLSDKIDCGVSPFDETTGDITISAWVKRTAAAATYAPIVSATQGVGGANTQFSFQFYGNSLSLFWKGLSGLNNEVVPTSAFTVANDVWYLINFVRTGTTGRFYVNGNFIHLSTKTYDDFISTGTPNLSIGAWWFSSNASVTGSISNVALWNTSLSALELREVYNEGRPSNLNNFSGTAPIHWWQLGSNSSFTSPNWTCLDEIGSSNGISSNMIEDRIVNGVGSSSNGVGYDLMGGGRKRTSTGFSQANGLSVNMTLANITGGVN